MGGWPAWRPLRLRQARQMGLRRSRPRGLDARQAHAGPGRSASDRTGVDRRSAAPRLRDHQTARREDRRMVQPEPRHHLPDADLSGRSRLCPASAEGSKKLYTITDEGRAYLEANREIVDAVLDRLSALGERVNRWRQRMRGERGERGSLPPLTEAALEHLRATISKRLEGDAD